MPAASNNYSHRNAQQHNVTIICCSRGCKESTKCSPQITNSRHWRNRIDEDLTILGWPLTSPKPSRTVNSVFKSRWDSKKDFSSSNKATPITRLKYHHDIGGTHFAFQPMEGEWHASMVGIRSLYKFEFAMSLCSIKQFFCLLWKQFIQHNIKQKTAFNFVCHSIFCLWYERTYVLCYQSCSKIIKTSKICWNTKSTLSRKIDLGSFLLIPYHSCRSTPARHAASPYQPKRHPNAQGKLKHYIL